MKMPTQMPTMRPTNMKNPPVPSPAASSAAAAGRNHARTPGDGSHTPDRLAIESTPRA
jgi:hypothetical protein